MFGKGSYLVNPASALQQHRDCIHEIARRHGVGSIAVFGSVARGEDRPDSDVDLLIEVTGPTSAWFPGGLVAELEALLGFRVDIAERRSLNPLLRDVILREARPL
jgi:hypothetical protein